MKRVGIYNRCSTEEEAQINALAIQAAESREKALAKGWEITEQYIESESGTTAYKRSEYQRLLDDMELDRFEIVMIKSIDRLMRSAKDWYIFLDRLTQNRKQLYIYIEDKFYTPDDSLITGIKAILAEDFSRELSKKIKNAHRRRQEKKSGLNITGPMFGWNRLSKDVFEINEEEAKAYRLAFELAKEGKGFYSIANIMYENGVRSKRGTRISEAQWRNMIYSSRAHGTVILHTSEYDFEAKRRIKLPEKDWIYIENALPAIISKEYQLEILDILSARTVENRFTDYSRDMSKVGLYTLSNKLYCADCGAVYYRTSFHSGEDKMIEWKCSNALKKGRRTEKNPGGCNNRNLVEETVMELIENTCKTHYEVLFGQEENIIDEALSAIRKVIGENSSVQGMNKLQKELDRQEKKKKVLFQKLMDEVIEDADFKAANRDISEKIVRLQNQISSIKARSSEYNGFEERLFKIREALNAGVVDRARTKEIIANIDRINVHSDGTLEIVFNRLKIFSLLKRYNTGFMEQELDDTLCRIIVKYNHKSKSEKKREEVNKQIVEYLRENPEVKLKELSAAVGMSESYVNVSVKMLKEQGVISYER